VTITARFVMKPKSGTNSDTNFFNIASGGSRSISFGLLATQESSMGTLYGSGKFTALQAQTMLSTAYLATNPYVTFQFVSQTTSSFNAETWTGDLVIEVESSQET
jgi:hypothetical protein